MSHSLRYGDDNPDVEQADTYEHLQRHQKPLALPDRVDEDGKLIPTQVDRLRTLFALAADIFRFKLYHDKLGRMDGIVSPPASTPPCTLAAEPTPATQWDM